MTVKVIEGPPSYTVRATCNGCKAKLEATREDLRVGNFGSLGDYDEAVYFECPLCLSDVRPQGVPYSLLEALKRESKDSKR